MNIKKLFTPFTVLLLIVFFLPIIAQAVTVGPVKLERSVDPGDVISGNVFLFNETGKTKTFYPVFEKYIEVDGQKKFIADECEIEDWFNIPSSITLGPGKQIKPPFTLSVPENAEPGGHFAVLWWSTAPPVKEGEKQMSIVTRAGILVYLRVSGDINEAGQLVDFSVQGNKRFFNCRPVPFEVVFESTGNVHLKPQGDIRIKNIFGRTKAILKVNEHNFAVFPQNKRIFKAVWSSEKTGAGAAGIFAGIRNEWQNFAFGLYKANLNLEYGEDVKEASGKIIFFVVPWRILSLAVIIFSLFGYGFIRGMRKYNRWIIAKSQK